MQVVRGVFCWADGEENVDAYSIVPKDFVENLKFRIRIRKRCEEDADFRRAMIQLCREDVLWFFSVFCWLHEPRPAKDEQGRTLPEVIPFIPWKHQEELVREIREDLGFEDIGVEKSRGEGMTWIAMLMALHDWIFAVPGTRLVTIAVVSRTMEMCDSPSDISSLMAKLDFELRRLPKWMVGEKDVDYKRLLKDHTLRNLRNDCLITGYAATGEVGSGGRYTYVVLDELSKFDAGNDSDALTSTQATTKSRLIIGTPYGSQGAYYSIMHKASSMKKLVLRWEDNPTRNRGLYRMVNGIPVAVDPATNPFPAHYNPPTPEVIELFSRLRKNGFRLEKRVRSPWYDHECDRADANPYKIAQELDRDYGGSLYKIFTDDFFIAARAVVRAPFLRASVVFDENLKPTINPAGDGELALWMTLDARHRPPDHSYVVGVDLSTGIGGVHTSNSAIEIIDAVTREQVGELVTNTTPPDEFADLAVAISNWLGNAYLAWEINGPGAAFSARIKEIGYPNVYLRTKLFDARRRKKIKQPGWWTDTKSKEVLFSELRRIVAVGDLKLHSDSLVKECEQYIRIGNTIKHVVNARASDETSGPDRGENHGDRVIAMGIAVQALGDRPVKLPGQVSPEKVEPNSIEERDRAYLNLLQDTLGDDWDERSTSDLMMGSSGFRGSGPF